MELGTKQALLNKSYPAKILLFGEHIVLNNAQALAIPFPKYNLSWNFSDSGDALIPFYSYLEHLDFIPSYRLDILRKAMPFFKSTIPIGYGLGSSGALCAAIYSFLFPNYANQQLKCQISRLAMMEGYFHGKSSGLDAIVSLQNQPILHSQSNISIISAFNHPFLKTLFLLDSNTPRSSKSMINSFLENSFEQKVLQKMVLLNNRIVNGLVSNSKTDLSNDLRLLSELQFNSFEQMILPSVKKIWEEGLASNDYCMKLCGAGGGGYYLIWGDPKIIQQLPLDSMQII